MGGRGTILAMLAMGAALGPLSPARAEARERFRLLINGTYATRKIDFSEARRFTEFAEQGQIDARYGTAAGPALDVGLEFFALRHVGLHVAFSSRSRDGTASWSASFPHPFFFGQPRRAGGDLDGLAYGENAFHVDAVGGWSRKAFDLAFFAGASFFSVDADVIETVRYSHDYPYDAVRISGVPTRKFSDRPSGFNVGGRFDYRFGASRRFGAGALLRFSRARVKISPSADHAVSFDAGGFQAGLGLRVSF